MKITYFQEGVDEPKVWDGLKLGRFRAKEIEAVERATRMNWGSDFRQALMMGNMLARRAIVWTLIKRDHPKSRLDDLDPFDDEIKVELSAAEWKELHDDVASGPLAPGRTEEDREQALAAIQAEIDKAAEAEAQELGSDGEGKAPSAAF